MAARPLLLRARTVVPDPASEIDDGAVLLHGDRVARVGRHADLAREGARVRDLGEVALLPGLVNAHAHLDLTGARGRFPPTRDFLGWIQQVRPFREAEGPEGPARASEEGGRELLASGCTLVADMVYEPSGLEGIRRSGIRAVAFREVLELGPALEHRPLRAALEGIEAGPDGEAFITPGLALHSPYTCSPEVIRRGAEQARRRRIPVSMHLSETRLELEWLIGGGGPFAPVLRRLVPEGWVAPGVGPAAFLHRLGFLEEPRLLAHGNHLEGEELRLVLESGSVVVHCPGSHAFFGHDRHPVAALRAAGVPVALGTDSLASHPDGTLSMTREMRVLAAREPSIPPRDLLAMATVNGAAGLGLAGLAGVLAPGSYADAAAFAVPGGWKGPESLLDPEIACTVAMVGGVWRHE
jgi:cytosine/adenosine deaminase-related metal-dependent hydrolase